MKSKYQLLKNLGTAAIIWGLLLLGITMVSCTDECETTETYIYMEPVYTPASVVRNSYESQEPRALEFPGKIYRKDQFLFINEFGKGVHIFNNNDRSNPQPIAFLNIPGNFDMAAMGQYLYVDSFVDLLVLDISDPTQVSLIRRIENAIDHVEILGFWVDENNGFITDFKEIESVQSYECDGPAILPNVSGGVMLSEFDAANRQNFGPGAGLGGSMARFTISQDHLYVVDHSRMHVFDLAIRTDPHEVNTIDLGWGIETIFPYQDKLFIGSNIGMQIFNNENPQAPEFLSEFDHAFACDPVVAQDNFAYVTLRSGNGCFGVEDQLDVVDITNIEQPLLVKSFPMDNPHGLAVDQNLLFICEGDFGLKVFDINDKLNIDKNLINHLSNIPSFDVIAIDSHLILVGKGGLYQFDYSDPSDLRLLSIIETAS